MNVELHTDEKNIVKYFLIYLWSVDLECIQTTLYFSYVSINENLFAMIAHGHKLKVEPH